MREIKFRGKEILTDRWVYGHYAYVYESSLDAYYYVIYDNGNPHIVKSSTVGQFSGLHDKAGKPIYEGDILHFWIEGQHIPNRDSAGGIIDFDRDEGFSQLGIVSFEGCSYSYKTLKTTEGRHEDIYVPIDWLDRDSYEVVGNSLDNPELT